MHSTNGTGLSVGVIGVGSMGQNHARIYKELPQADLVGVFDTDTERAQHVADEYDTDAVELDQLLDSVTAVSVAVPTQFHFNIATQCLEYDVAPLIEKPVVESISKGRELQQLAADAAVPIQIGHIERFNPAVQVTKDILHDHTVLAVDAKRLGPPPEREIDDSAVIDLMIHDIDVVLSLLQDTPVSISSAGIRNNRYGTATLEFDSGSIATLTASRVTQRKVRSLEITTEECVIEVDYMEQNVQIHRQSLPSYVEKDEGMRYRHECIVERPTVPSTEPLREELQSFLDTVATGSRPDVTVEDGLQALTLAKDIEAQALDNPEHASSRSLTHE